MSKCFICKKNHNIENILSCDDIISVIITNLKNYNKEYYLDILNKYKNKNKLNNISQKDDIKENGHFNRKAQFKLTPKQLQSKLYRFSFNFLNPE